MALASGQCSWLLPCASTDDFRSDHLLMFLSRSKSIQAVIIALFLQGAFGWTGSTMFGGTIADILSVEKCEFVCLSMSSNGHIFCGRPWWFRTCPRILWVDRNKLQTWVEVDSVDPIDVGEISLSGVRSSWHTLLPEFLDFTFYCCQCSCGKLVLSSV